MSSAFDSFRLDDRVAVVTGASSGLGVEFARTLSGAGAAVVVAARRKDRLDSLVAELESGGGRAVAVECDVVDPEQVGNLVAKTKEAFGRADVLVANAGVSDPQPAEFESFDVWNKIVGVNLTGVFLCDQAFGRLMLEQRSGSIVNVSSVLGQVGAGQIPQASYTASKGGVSNMTRELAAQWARRGVRVNALAPGWFRSEMTEEMFEAEQGVNWIRKKTPMGRPGEPTELNGAVLFLASDASNYVTGQVVTVDGGWTCI